MALAGASSLEMYQQLILEEVHLVVAKVLIQCIQQTMQEGSLFGIAMMDLDLHTTMLQMAYGILQTQQFVPQSSIQTEELEVVFLFHKL